jgi:diguanylate cyclase (GGDEF)-like protein
MVNTAVHITGGERKGVLKKSRVVYESNVGELLGSEENLEVKIHRFAGLLSDYLSGAATSVFLYEPEAGQLFLKSTSLASIEHQTSFRFSADGTVAALAINERRVVSLREADRPPGSALQGSYHFFPLEAGEEVLGVITTQVVAPEGLGPVQLDVVRRTAARFAAVVGREKRDAESSGRMIKISAINEAGVTLVSLRSLTELLQTTTAITALIMGAGSSVIRTFDEASGNYLVGDCYGLGDKDLKQQVLELDRRATEEAIAGGRPLLVRNTSSRSAFREFAGIAPTFICHPLRDEKDVVGTISIFNKHTGDTFAPPYFTEEDLSNLSVLARYIGKAVGGAMTHEKEAALRDRDELTGLPDAGYFATRLESEVSRAQRFDGKMVVLSCETSLRSTGESLDHRNRYRKLIRAVAEAVRSTLRDYDIVASVGEGRFAMILPQAEDGTVSATMRVRLAVERTVEEYKALVPGMDPEVSFSTARFPEDGKDAGALLEALGSS